MSTCFDGIDLAFRPSARLFPMPAERLLLSKVKGTRRREVLALAVEEDRLHEVDPFFMSTGLSNEERRARSAVHPSFMGGEYLPDFEEGEIEVARLDLRSVTADAISIRLKATKVGFVYRVVDEYMDEYDNGLLESPSTTLSDTPLCLGDFGRFVVHATRLLDIIDPERFDSEDEAQEFVFASSEFYPEFDAYIAEVISLNYQKDHVDEDEKEFVDKATTAKNHSDLCGEDGR